jgi:hypothetical protein
VTEAWTPDLRLDAKSGRCRLTLVGVARGSGHTLQDAANDLLARLFDLATAFHSGRFRFSGELGVPDHRLIAFLWEVADIIARGGDIRPRVFGPPAPRAAVD